MRLQFLVAASMCGCACAQVADAKQIDRVAAVLRVHDPMRNGNGAAELLADDSLDRAIRATAAAPTAEQVVRTRALRVVRALDLAQRVGNVAGQRDLAWWLAFGELDRDVPKAVRPLLLARAFADPEALAAAQRELATASDTARAFSIEWNETRLVEPVTDEQRKQYLRYDELEAALNKAGMAAVPFLLSLVAVPPEVVVPNLHEDQGVSARQQVRALLALSAILKVKEAVPYFVLLLRGPSLTMSATAAMAIQQAAGEDFGAAFLKPGDEEAILAWWHKHRARHGLILDHLVRHVVQRGLDDLAAGRKREGAWCSVRRLGQVLGKDEAPRDAGPEVLRALLEDREREWLQERRR